MPTTADRRSQDRVTVSRDVGQTTDSGSHQKASSTSPDAPSISVVNLRRSALLMRARFQSRWMLPLRA